MPVSECTVFPIFITLTLCTGSLCMYEYVFLFYSLVFSSPRSQFLLLSIFPRPSIFFCCSHNLSCDIIALSLLLPYFFFALLSLSLTFSFPSSLYISSYSYYPPLHSLLPFLSLIKSNPNPYAREIQMPLNYTSKHIPSTY